MSARSTQQFKPVTGTYTVPKNLRAKAVPSHVFDLAWQNAIEKAVAQWGVAGNGTKVEVRYQARIDIWNPGGIGWCGVTLIPGGG